MNSKRFALITGCGKGGIGHALALEFKSQGFNVFATLLSHEPREHLTEAEIHAYASDVTNDEDVTTLKEAIESETKSGYTMTAMDTDVREVERMFSVNVFGPMRMVHVFHPLLIRAKGTVVNIGSVGGIVPYVYGSSYNASKAALHHWGNTLRVEMKPFDVKVVNIISGEVGTNILKRDQSSLRKLPENSFYRPLEKDFESHINRIPATTPAAEYARSVVAEVIKANPKAWLWTGARAGEVRFWNAFFPVTFWDWLFTREFGLNRLRQ
ncbi:short chain dehydrogenase [Microdochium trichocladiopsis]|uniref:Short chain dehydrogenase n=1 Tax=Microdochium trichocladiopsis TaxID=1682393 RepID=A0A9P8YG80_9PEZI|nr:short chain dehydrogenase [Microdochium trichocladiopsis]KAH7038347.1 short chain dehydrogenase [Microdochium trichocladiopsis]